MYRIIEAEIKKLHSSKMWLMIIIGAILPGVITYLSFLGRKGLTWLEYLHVTMLIYNVQSLLTFSAFAAYICAREYEENTMDITLCYPYPKYYFLIAKLIIMFLLIALTTFLFGTSSLVSGAMYTSHHLQHEMLVLFIKVLLQLIVMHFLLMPLVFLTAMITRLAISGIILGIVNMCLCMMLYKTNFIQFIPPCIPFVLSDHLLGMDVMNILPDYYIHWSILAVCFALMLAGCISFRIKIYSRS